MMKVINVVDSCYECTENENSCLYSTADLTLNEQFLGEWVAVNSVTYPNLTCTGSPEDDGFDTFGIHIQDNMVTQVHEDGDTDLMEWGYLEAEDLICFYDFHIIAIRRWMIMGMVNR